jgi:hypothetical protein
VLSHRGTEAQRSFLQMISVPLCSSQGKLTADSTDSADNERIGSSSARVARYFIVTPSAYSAQSAVNSLLADLCASVPLCEHPPRISRTALSRHTPGELFDQQCIFAALGQSIAMRAALGDVAVFEDKNLVGVADRAQPVGDDEAGISCLRLCFAVPSKVQALGFRHCGKHIVYQQSSSFDVSRPKYFCQPLRK